MKEPGASPDESDSPGLPGLRTWPAVYLFVLITFAVSVVLLTVLTRAFA